MKILIDCRFWGLEHAGLGRYVSNLVKNIITLDKKNKYVLLITEEKKKEISSLLPKVKVEVVPINARHYSFKEQIVVPLVLKNLKYDLLHTPHFNVPILTAFKRSLVLTIHDLIKDESRGLETTTRHPMVYFIKYLGYKVTMWQALQKAAKIIIPSKWVKKEVIKRYGVSEDKLRVVYEGANDKFTGMAKGQNKKSKILKKYKIQKPYFIYVGSAYPHKNLRNLIFAIKLINSSINLVIVCSRDVFLQRFKKQIIQANVDKYINLVGFIPDDDLKILYQNAVAFITPSLMEGFGLPGIEAMASGCPVIASKKAALPEIYGQAAHYFNPENLDEIRDKMVEILKLSVNKRRKIIQKGIKQARKYSWQRCARETLKIYGEVTDSFSLR